MDDELKIKIYSFTVDCKDEKHVNMGLMDALPILLLQHNQHYKLVFLID